MKVEGKRMYGRCIDVLVSARARARAPVRACV